MILHLKIKNSILQDSSNIIQPNILFKMKILNIKSVIFFLCIFLFANSFAQEVEGGIVGETWIAGKKRAEEFYNKLAYHDAIALYNKLLKKKEDPQAQAQLADCYRLIGDYTKAADAYNKATTIGNTSLETYLHQAQMLQITKDYKGAEVAYKKYLQTNPNDVRAKNELAAVQNPEQFNKSNRYNVSNLSINTKYFDFAPTYFNDGLYFASDRDAEKAIGNEHSWLGTTFFDIYFAKGEKLEFAKANNVKKDGESKYHDAAPSFSPDGKTVYFTRNNYIDNKLKKSTDKVVKQGIYESVVDGNKWKDIKAFKYNNPEYDVAHPALTADGNTMYFSSNKPGGKGGMDLYVTQKNGTEWSEPVNLSALNTEGDELFPSVDKNGNLYFASNGLGGLGGLDIFRTSKSSSITSFSQPANIGTPINSSYDDFGVAFSKESNLGYFTSNRTEGKGSDDIWSFTDNGIYLEGIVVDAITKQPINNSNVEMLQNNISKGKKVTLDNGIFKYDAEPNKKYNFNASAERYAANNEITADTKDVKPGETVKVIIPLMPNKPAGYSVQVVDKISKKEIKNATVDIVSQTDVNKYQQQITGVDGKTCYTILCGNDYLATAAAKGYLPASQSFSTKNNCEQLVDCGNIGGQTLIVELDRDPNSGIVYDENGNVVSEDELVREIKDIYYDFDRWNLRDESKPQLNKLLKFMQENPDAVAEIASNTDARATNEYNIQLSQKRAQSVVDWLVKNGISKNRLKPVGYGETKLRNNCADGVQCSEYEHQRNRRTEFRIIGGKVDVKSLERFDMQVDPCKVCPF